MKRQGLDARDQSKGRVVIMTPADPAAEVGQPIAERCVASP